MALSSNLLYPENKRYNRIGKRGVEGDSHFIKKINKIEISFDRQLAPLSAVCSGHSYVSLKNQVF